ncbi:hypothetical protein Tco_0926107 [Tanacetum coccineum]|uniref:Uncharacterized protein n=1 Tax=Tanacetum coccineum TaxID=301880 RepID=A0ABQ5DAU1_9ASTR
MRMRQYISHTDHNLWNVVVNEDLEEEPASTGETSAPPAPKIAKQLAAKRNQERVKSILLLAIPDEYLLKFYNVPYAKSLWEAIKSRFRGNEKSKKMQKNVLKHQFENFSTASNKSLNKAYDRFQKLISQLEVHGVSISKEDINQKFLRSVPTSWNQIALIMRNKPGLDEIDIDDLYNNHMVYEDEMKSTASGDKYSVFLIDGDDLEELDLQWQVAMLTVRVKKKGHFAREYRSGRNQGRRSYGDNGRSNAPTNESSSHALVAQDGLGGYDWSNDFEVEPFNYALMAICSSSSSSSSDNEYLNLELEKVVKEKDELKIKIEKWEESSKNLDELLNSQMSARDKTGLGYGTQLNEMSNNSETDSEISLSVFYVRSSDEESTPANDRSSKADGYHVVPPPITGNFLTPRADISFAGKTNEMNTQKPKTVYESVNRDKVIIEDWNSDDEDDVSEVQTVSPTFVPSGVLTRTGLIIPVKQNEKRAVHKVSTVRPVSTARPVSNARPVSTVIPFAPKIAQTSGAIRPIYPNFTILEDIDAYRDEGMGDVIFGEPFLREVGINAKRFKGMIIIYNEFMIIAGADNRPPMLERSMYDSWKSRMELYIENKEKGRMILNYVLNGPLVWATVDEENGTTRTKKYEELSIAEKLQADYDLKATNIVL